jgi:hypothetical protein
MSRDLRRLTVRLSAQGTSFTRQVKLRTVPSGPDSTITEFIFPFAPIAVNYSDLGPEYVEVERTQNLPIVDLRGFRLLKVDLSFLVATPFDGIKEPVDRELRAIRGLANSIYPVAFFNMDGMLTNPFEIKRTGVPRSGLFFRIPELSINAVRRNLNNQVTAAEVDMTLVEVANPKVDVVQFPDIEYPENVTPQPSNTKPPAQAKPPGSDPSQFPPLPGVLPSQ